ncbi:MAG: PP2C family protein-serine/threonine phosphatase [Acidobacteriota bacterium]
MSDCAMDCAIDYQPVVHERLEPDVFGLAIPAGDFTGDFYFTAQVGDRLRFALGDVTGKGLRAAVLMSMIQEELDRSASSRMPLGRTIDRIHRSFFGQSDGRRFVSMVIGDLDCCGGVEIINAGHCPPLIKRNGGSIERIGSHGPVAGLLEKSRWATARYQLEPGESLLLYTDGLLEARSSAGEEYGVNRIAESLRRSRGPASDTVHTVIRNLREHRAHGAIEDDLTLLAIAI